MKLFTILVFSTLLSCAGTLAAKPPFERPPVVFFHNGDISGYVGHDGPGHAAHRAGKNRRCAEIRRATLGLPLFDPVALPGPPPVGELCRRPHP